jgi:hypothetical protein
MAVGGMLGMGLFVGACGSAAAPTHPAPAVGTPVATVALEVAAGGAASMPTRITGTVVLPSDAGVFHVDFPGDAPLQIRQVNHVFYVEVPPGDRARTGLPAGISWVAVDPARVLSEATGGLGRAISVELQREGRLFGHRGDAAPPGPSGSTATGAGGLVPTGRPAVGRDGTGRVDRLHLTFRWSTPGSGGSAPAGRGSVKVVIDVAPRIHPPAIVAPPVSVTQDVTALVGLDPSADLLVAGLAYLPR